MKRLVYAGMAVAAFAMSASAEVSIRLEGPGAVGTSGIITLRTYATADGGETDNTIFGAINYPDALVSANPAGNSQTPLFTSQGALTCTTAFCVAFSQVNAAGPIAVNLRDTLIAVTTFVIDPGGPPSVVLNFTWRTTPSTQRLDWFGISNAPGVSVTTGIIPEPTTGALLGVGLLGLALAHRRRHD